jgi:Uma2 family endonuclease
MTMAEKIKQRMTAAEFLQLPETMQKMELIEGELIVSPSPVLRHQKIVFAIAKLLDSLKPNGLVVVSPMDVEFDINDVYQPDTFWIAESGKAVEVEGHIVGAPDLIVEVLSPSTAKYDKKQKFNTYEKFGVREYWMADPDGEYIEVWVLKNKKFARLGIFDKDENFDSQALGKNVVLKDVFN